MQFHRKYSYSFLFLLLGIVSLLVLQSIWICHSYKAELRHIISEIEDAFDLAYQKEQTYRVPVVDIITPGELTIQGCGKEEILIVRKCFDSDTIVYHNISGHSIESFISRVFHDLREQMVPMNIYCLSDLFAGMLYDRNIPVSFVIERFDTGTGTILETSLFPDEKQREMNPELSIVSEISDTEAVRAILQVSPATVFGRMNGTLICTIILAIFTLACMVFLFCKRQKEEGPDIMQPPVTSPEPLQENGFQIGQYHFDPGKNELQGFGEVIQLNKKENAILYALCIQQGNVVERNALLEENWGSSGMIYSRSLDTYLTTLRKYLKKDPSIQIVTVKGVGYKLVSP
ncbi:MAG: winged helix-turn-helix domain-containing protein [Bacteroidales bacterium]|jgi:DNA-binding winged helix-turn-helix (wHTH) protein|nr:winged helix-turn-helix domain-containing protein [Bacteroidales bacterium]